MIEWNLTYDVYIGIKLAKFDDDNLVLKFFVQSTIFANNSHQIDANETKVYSTLVLNEIYGQTT